MPFLLLFFVLFLPASVYLRHGLIVTATKAFLLCAIPAGTYRVQSPGFLKIVYIAKVNAEISDFFISYYYSRDDSSEPFPVTASEPVVNSPPTQEGKQTSQKSRNTSDSPRSNQNQMRTVDCNEGPQDRGYQKQC